MKELYFADGSVPVYVAARIYGKSSYWVRAGIIEGWLDIGIATRNGRPVSSVTEINGRLGRINYYISPLKLYEATGFVWKGEKK